MALPPRLLLAALDEVTLAAAVQDSRSWRQVSLKLGLPSSRHVRKIQALCDSWNVPHEHLAHRAPPDDQLREVLTTATSWSEAMTRLGFAEDSGTARATIRKHARRLGLDLARFAEPLPPQGTASAMQPHVRHLRDAGAYLVAGAFVLAGHRVSWPLEPAPYDLVVDSGGRLLRVQVKTTTQWVGGFWSCSITRSEYADVSGGKRQVRYRPDEIDAFAVVDGFGDIYVIPVDDVADLTALSLRRYARYRIPRLRSHRRAGSDDAESG
ncbi:MAG: group I intron-associated PD-(D/E)XK endonuclease [Mycobacteriales bacterium]